MHAHDDDAQHDDGAPPPGRALSLGLHVTDD